MRDRVLLCLSALDGTAWCISAAFLRVLFPVWAIEICDCRCEGFHWC